MPLFRHEHDSDEEEGDVESPNPEEEFLTEAVAVQTILDKLKVDVKIDYLEAWRKDYIERINKLIDWTLQDPKMYSDVITMQFKFEEFFTQMMMIVGHAESMKRAYKDIKKRVSATKDQHMEIS